MAIWERFSGRVQDYVRYRPTYSAAAVQFLREEFRLPLSAVIADVGSGTGILTKQFLDLGFTVHAVEPGDEMRQVAEEILKGIPNFRSHKGDSTKTGLERASVDLITAAQAFHWFDLEPTRIEFRRILKANGGVALLWNERDKREGFGAEYEKFLSAHSVDYDQLHRGIAEVPIQSRMEILFAPAKPMFRAFANPQSLDWDGLWGRFRSTSYSPKEGDVRFEPARRALRELFERYQKNARVSFAMNTDVYFGRLT